MIPINYSEEKIYLQANHPLPSSNFFHFHPIFGKKNLTK